MLIGRKLGMTRIFTESGESVPVTVIKASPCFVIDRRTEEKDGYSAYVMGFGEKKEQRVKKPVLGLCKKAGIPPVEVIREFRVNDTSAFDVGEKIPVSLLQKGDKVNVVGFSKGRGFQGVVKRWHFSGGPASHGSTFHRTPGSAGAGTYPGRVLKGKKFPGRMGNDRVTVKNLEVVTLDEEKGLVVVRGAVPGFTNGLVLIKIDNNIDVSARKELAKEKLEKAKVEKEREKVEEKVEEVVTEEKVEEKTEEKAEAKVDKKEDIVEKIKDKTKKAEKKEEKAKKSKVEVSKEKTEEKVEEVVVEEKVEEKVEEAKEKAEEKAEENIEDKEKEETEKKEEKIESVEETKETKDVDVEEKKEEEAEEVKEEAIEAKTETDGKEVKDEPFDAKTEDEDKKVKNEGDEEEKTEEEDQSKEKGDS